MIVGALGTLLCFAITPVFAQGAMERLGSIAANFWRLLVAVLLLGGWTWIFGSRVSPAVEVWLLLGGVAGFGVGGAALFLSLPGLGASLSTLVVQCGAVAAAVAIEWLWLERSLTYFQLLSVIIIVGGVALGLLPRSWPVSRSHFHAGFAWAVVSAIGQGAGAVISRKAFVLAAAQRCVVDPGTAAFIRAIGGLIVATLWFAILSALRRAEPRATRSAWRWVLANAITGPVLGVTCYQWALRSAPAALVQPIVAAAPLLTVPLAIAIGDAPRPRLTYYAGTALAVAGTALLLLAR